MRYFLFPFYFQIWCVFYPYSTSQFMLATLQVQEYLRPRASVLDSLELQHLHPLCLPRLFPFNCRAISVPVS